MRRGDALKRAFGERGQVAAVARGDEIRDVAAGFIDSPQHRLRRAQRLHRQPRRRRGRKALIDVDLGAGGMIDDHQRHMVEEVRLPQLGGDAQIVAAVASRQLVAANAYPVFGLRDTRRVLRIDAKAERRAPQEVGHERDVAAVVGEHPRARPLQPLLRDEAIVDADAELGLRHAVGPDDPRHVDGRTRAEAEVHGATPHHLLLPDQTGLDLDLAADAERVDALVARVLLCTGGEGLPVITPAPLPEPAPGRVRRHAHQIEEAIVVGVGDGPGLAADRGRKRRQRVGFVGQPDARGTGPRHHDVQRPVVVQIGREDAHAAGAGPGADHLRVPARAAPGQAPQAALRVDGHEIDGAIRVEVRGGDRGERGDAGRRLDRREAAGLTVEQHAQHSRAVDERGIRIGVPIEVGPRKASYAGDAGKRVERLPRGVTVVAQHARGASRADDEVDVAVHVDVGRPQACDRRAARGRGGSASRGRRVAERAVLALEQQLDPRCPGAREIHPEVVVPVESGDDGRGRWSRGRHRRPADETQAIDAFHVDGHLIRPGAVDGHQRQRRGAGEHFTRERERGVGRCRTRARRFERHEPIERRRDQLGGRPHRGQALRERGDARQHVAQQRRGPGGVGKARSRRGLAQRRQLFLRDVGPARRLRRDARHRVVEARAIGHLRRQPRAFEQHGEIRRGERDQLVVEPGRLSIGLGRTGALQLVGQREPRLQRARVERRRSPQARHRFVEPPARHFHAPREHHDVDVRGREFQRPLHRHHRRVEFAEPELRQPQVGPGRRLLRHEGGGLRELLARVVEQADFEGRQAVVEGARDLFVGFRARRGQRRAAHIVDAGDQGERSRGGHEKSASAHRRILALRLTWGPALAGPGPPEGGPHI